MWQWILAAAGIAAAWMLWCCCRTAGRADEQAREIRAREKHDTQDDGEKGGEIKP